MELFKKGPPGPAGSGGDGQAPKNDVFEVSPGFMTVDANHFITFKGGSDACNAVTMVDPTFTVGEVTGAHATLIVWPGDYSAEILNAFQELGSNIHIVVMDPARTKLPDGMTWFPFDSLGADEFLSVVGAARMPAVVALGVPIINGIHLQFNIDTTFKVGGGSTFARIKDCYLSAPTFMGRSAILDEIEMTDVRSRASTDFRDYYAELHGDCRLDEVTTLGTAEVHDTGAYHDEKIFSFDTSLYHAVGARTNGAESDDTSTLVLETCGKIAKGTGASYRSKSTSKLLMQSSGIDKTDIIADTGSVGMTEDRYSIIVGGAGLVVIPFFNPRPTAAGYRISWALIAAAGPALMPAPNVKATGSLTTTFAGAGTYELSILDDPY